MCWSCWVGGVRAVVTDGIGFGLFTVVAVLSVALVVVRFGAGLIRGSM